MNKSFKINLLNLTGGARQPEPSRDTVLEAHTPPEVAPENQSSQDIQEARHNRDSRYTRMRDFRIRLNNGETNFQGIDLSSVNLAARYGAGNATDQTLSGIDFSGANFTSADLEGVDFTDANLRGANLTFTDLTNAILKGSNLRDAVLAKADITNTSFDRRTNLKNVNFGSYHPRLGGEKDLAFIDAGTVSTIGIARNVPNYTWQNHQDLNYIRVTEGIRNATDDPWPYPGTSTPEPEPEPVRELGYTAGQDAWEIHNRTDYSYKRIKKYLELLVTQESLNLEPIDSLLEEMVEMRDWLQDDKSKDVFKKLLMFYKLFYKKLDGAKDLDEGLRKIFNKVKKARWQMNSERSVELSIYALKYMIKTNDEELLKRFMERYVEETVGAYTSGTDGTSCVKGCQERILLYFDEQLRARCCSQGAKCDWIKEDIKLKICLLPIEIALNNIYNCKKTSTGYSGKDCEVFMSYLQEFTSDANADKDEEDQKDDPFIVLEREKNLKTFLFEEFSQGITDRDEIAQLKKAINEKITEMVENKSLNFQCKDLYDLMTDPENCKMVEISDEVRTIVEDYKKRMPNTNPLYSSMHNGNFDNFKKLIPFYDVNKFFIIDKLLASHHVPSKFKPLMAAIAAPEVTDDKVPPKFEIIKYLIEAGADPNVIEKPYSVNALSGLVYLNKNSFPQQSEIIKLLINNMSVEGLNNNNNKFFDHKTGKRKFVNSYEFIAENYEGSNKNEILDLIKAKGGKSGVESTSGAKTNPKSNPKIGPQPDPRFLRVNRILVPTPVPRWEQILTQTNLDGTPPPGFGVPNDMRLDNSDSDIGRLAPGNWAEPENFDEILYKLKGIDPVKMGNHIMHLQTTADGLGQAVSLWATKILKSESLITGKRILILDYVNRDNRIMNPETNQITQLVSPAAVEGVGQEMFFQYTKMVQICMEYVCAWCTHNENGEIIMDLDVIPGGFNRRSELGNAKSNPKAGVLPMREGLTKNMKLLNVKYT